MPARRVPSRLATVTFATAVLLAGCSADPTSPIGSGIDPSFNAAADPPQVPFRLTVTSESSTAAPGGRCGPFPMITLDLEGEAVSTQLGHTTFRQSHCFDAFDPSTFTDGEFTYTGADGSAITGTYHGFLSPTSDPTVLTINGIFVITGGIRRFAGATGGGTATGTLDVVSNRVTLELTGTVSSTGSTRRR